LNPRPCVLYPVPSALNPESHILNPKAPDGRCKTLDAAADGYVRTEAVWALPLWSVERPTSSSSAATAAAAAVRAAPALLVSSAVNQDGRSSSLTAPHGPSQQEVNLEL